MSDLLQNLQWTRKLILNDVSTKRLYRWLFSIPNRCCATSFSECTAQNSRAPGSAGKVHVRHDTGIFEFSCEHNQCTDLTEQIWSWCQSDTTTNLYQICSKPPSFLRLHTHMKTACWLASVLTRFSFSDGVGGWLGGGEADLVMF